jgi:hypothetical protein
MEFVFCLTKMAWNGGSRFWPARLEWHGMKEVSFGPTGIAWNRGSRFWPDLNVLEWRKSVLGLSQMTWNGRIWF